MPSINFQSQWAGAVELGARLARGETIEPAELLAVRPKRTTIRRPGRVRPGFTLHLFTEQRTPRCRRLGVVLCLAVTPITVTEDEDFLLGPDECFLNREQREQFARLDTAGMWSADELVQFFRLTYGLPFAGELITW